MRQKKPFIKPVRSISKQNATKLLADHTSNTFIPYDLILRCNHPIENHHNFAPTRPPMLLPSHIAQIACLSSGMVVFPRIERQVPYCRAESWKYG